MKFSVLQENLAKGLSTVARSVATRPQLPILGNILITTEEGRVRLSATNLETGINCWVGAKILEEGAFTVPARVFLEFVSSLPKDKVEISLEGSQLFAKSGGFEASFNGIPSSEFPPLPVFPKEATFSFENSFFAKAVERVSFAAATDEGRPVLTGVLLRFFGKDLFFVATDGYRMSLVKMANPLGEKEERKIILPARTLSEVLRVLSEKESSLEKTKEKKEEVSFALLPSGNQAIFSAASSQIVTQVIGGEFPPYEKIIPSSLATKTVLFADDLLKAVKMAAIFARESANIIRFKVSSGVLTVSANTPQVGTNKSSLDVKGEGEGEIAFNSRYLLDFLNVVSGKEISLEMAGPLSPGVFKIVGEDSFLHIIMPVRVQG